MTSRAINLRNHPRTRFQSVADTFYATLELNNIRMDGLLFGFLDKYRHNAIFFAEFGRTKPTNLRPSGTLRVNVNENQGLKNLNIAAGQSQNIDLAYSFSTGTLRYVTK